MKYFDENRGVPGSRAEFLPPRDTRRRYYGKLKLCASRLVPRHLLDWSFFSIILCLLYLPPRPLPSGVIIFFFPSSCYVNFRVDKADMHNPCWRCVNESTFSFSVWCLMKSEFVNFIIDGIYVFIWDGGSDSFISLDDSNHVNYSEQSSTSQNYFSIFSILHDWILYP